jgi:hypothetical protein
LIGCCSRRPENKKTSTAGAIGVGKSWIQGNKSFFAPLFFKKAAFFLDSTEASDFPVENEGASLGPPLFMLGTVLMGVLSRLPQTSN